MRTVKWNAFLSGLCATALALGAVAGGARADVTIEKGASILVFPKVRVNSNTDTIIQIANTGNSMVHAKCFYVDASLYDLRTGAACSIPSQTCVPKWQETDFSIWLTLQQPTHWRVSTGRRFDPFDGFGHSGSGFDPGHIPPQDPFEGELKCIEVSESHEPVTGNHLKGEATIKTTSGADINDVSKYNAIGIRGNPDLQPSNPLLLDGEVYDACPAKLIVNHASVFSQDNVAALLAGDNLCLNGSSSCSSVTTELTLVPCSEDFENQEPASAKVQFVVTNEFEERFSASTTVTCYLSTDLTLIDAPQNPRNSVFSVGVLGTDTAVTVITPVADGVTESGGVVGISERTVTVTRPGGTLTARAAYNIHGTGDLMPAVGPDRIVLPEPF